MKYSRFHIAAFLFVAAIFLIALAFKAETSRGQSQNTNKSSTAEATESKVKATVLLTDRSSNSSSASTFSAAAARNTLLRNDLVWTFGSKQQRGWYLYTSLINRLIGTDENADSNRFAEAVARWQKNTGLTPSGVLDETSLNAMISEWQRARLKNRAYAQPQELLTAPVSDFHDPERVEELRRVERETYAAYKRMVAAAVADPSLGLAHDASGGLAPAEKYLKILSAFRSREYQDQLRRQTPGAGSAGLAVNSPHFTGRALDLYVGGEPVETKDSNRAIQVQTPVYQWLVRNADRFGFRPYYYEPWHWEYVNGEGRKQ